MRKAGPLREDLSDSSDSSYTEGEIGDVHDWLDKTPPKVLSTLRRLARSKSFEKFGDSLKTMASPFKETDKPVVTVPDSENGGEPSVNADNDNPDDKRDEANVPAAEEKAEPQVIVKEPEEIEQMDTKPEPEQDETDSKVKDPALESDEETEEEAKLEKFIEEKIAELPQEDRPEVTLVFDCEGRTPTHDDGKIHVIPPNNGHEGQQRNAFYGKPPYAKDTKLWFGWPHSDPGKPVQYGFVKCDKPFFIDEVPEPLYTLDFGSSWKDDASRPYYEKCLFPQSRLFFYHESNRTAVARGRPRVNNPKNWDGLPNLKELPRGTIIVRNGMCFKLLSHIEHCSAVWAQLCHKDGTVIGGPADADILHYETDFKAPNAEAKTRMLQSIKEAEIQKTKTANVLGKVLRAETQKRKHRKPYKREIFTSTLRSGAKTTASHFSSFLLPEAQVMKERNEAMFGSRHTASSIGSSQDNRESDRRSEVSSRAAETALKAVALKESEQKSLVLENQALRKEYDDLKLAFGQMMSSFQDMQKEKDEKLSAEAQLTREQAHEKNFPLEAALLAHYKQQKELADKEKNSLQRQRDDLAKALELKRNHVVELQERMREELAAVKSKAESDPQASSGQVLSSIARDQTLKGTALEMFSNRAQMTKLEEMLSNATSRCLEAGIEVPSEVMEIVKEHNEKAQSFGEGLFTRTVHFEDEDPAPNQPDPKDTASVEMKESLEEESGIGDIVVDEDAKKAEAQMLKEEHTHEEAEKHSPQPRTGIAVVLGDDGYYYDSDGRAFHSDDVMKVREGLNIVTHPVQGKIVSTVQLLASKKDNQISSAIESVVGSSSRDETRRSLFKDDDAIETYDIERFRTATPDCEEHCTLFPSPIDSGDELNMTVEEFVTQNQCNDRTEKYQKLEAMSQEKHEQRLDHVRRVAEAEIAAIQGSRAMEQALKASRSRQRTPPFLIENIADKDVQALRDLDVALATERSKLREKERKAEEAKKLEKEKKAEERRRKKEEKERQKAAAEARRAQEHEEELRKQQQEEHDRKEKRRQDKEERRRQREYELSGEAHVQQLQREQEFAERERKRKAELNRDAELIALRAKYQKLKSEAEAKQGRKRKLDDDSSDEDLKKKSRKEGKPLPKEVERLLQAKRSELQSLKEKSTSSASATRATPEAGAIKHRFRGTCIPETGYVAQDIQPPFEMARRPGKVEDRGSFLYPNEAGWRWNWTMFSQVPLKVIQRKSLETNQVNINEYQAMQLAAGFVTMNMNRMDNFLTKELAYQELRQAIEAVAAMADGTMRQVRAAIHNLALRDVVVQAALMTNVLNGADYRMVALKQLHHIRNAVTNKFHYDAKRRAGGGGASASGGPGGEDSGAAASTHSSDSG